VYLIQHKKSLDIYKLSSSILNSSLIQQVGAMLRIALILTMCSRKEGSRRKWL
jgi:hypothetical protein